MKIVIIGAGPSGMVAAIRAAEGGHAVTVLEKNTSVGRKLLATGGGHCNLTNDGVAAEKYICAETRWMDALLGHFGVEQVVDQLRDIGVAANKTSDGWYYPQSNSSQTVVDAFASALKRPGIELRLASQVTSISRSGKKFLVKVTGGNGSSEETFDKVIVGAGGMAYPNLGSTGDLFPILKQLGHRVIPKRPALAPLLVDLQEFGALQGVRLDVGTRLWNGEQLLAEAAGNMIFTEWGINGPAVMDISQAVSGNPEAQLALSLNFIKFIEPEFTAQLAQMRKTDLPVKILLGAFFPPKVVELFLKIQQIPDSLALRQLDDGALQLLFGRLSDTRLPVRGVKGFEFCQVSAGGVPVAEVDPVTLESHLVQGLHLIGETVDVVGPCGGYNLHYAFASGALAGLAMGKSGEA